jgi:hypothetical protein
LPFVIAQLSVGCGCGSGSSSSYSDIEARQQRIEEDIHNINASLTGFSDHFYSIFLAPTPPPSFYPFHPYFPPRLHHKMIDLANVVKASLFGI